MEEIFKEVTNLIALILEAMATLLIAYGGFSALFKLIKFSLPQYTVPTPHKMVWRDFAGWLLLGLEFTLGADIVRTAIAPTWDSIGQLAAIAVIRTFLGFFLERDYEIASKKEIH